MKNRIIALIMTIFCGLSICACGSENTVAKASGSHELLHEGKLVVGTNAAFPPFEYIGDDGKPDGFDIALIKAIGDELGLEVEIQDMEFDSLVASIGSKIDVSIAGMTITEERKNAVDFSDSYYDAVQYVLVPNGSEIKGYDDLKGKKIGSQMGTTGDFISEDIKAEDDSTTISTYDKALDAVNDLVNGRVDAVILDKNPAEVFAGQYDEVSALDGNDFGFEPEKYAIALSKGNTELGGKINDALKTLKENGTYDELIKKYIEVE